MARCASFRRGLRALACTGALAVLPAGAHDLPPELVARFTRQVQPLILNRCAAGACHGGPAAHAPRFTRGETTGAGDRQATLANIDTLLDTLGPDRDARPLLFLLASRHPAAAKPHAPTADALAPRQRAALENWLAAVRATERRRDPAVMPASASVAVPAPNPFRKLLDDAANPPPLPPPQEPQGVIFPRDEPPPDDAAP
jgi:hypothetical protein